MFDYTEFNKLVAYLTENNYDFQVMKFRGGKQVKVYDDVGMIFDIVIHEFSYGNDGGLLEGYGVMYEMDAYGWLTAEDVIEKLKSFKRK